MGMNPLAQRPWLITGAAGFLGSHVVEELLGQGMTVIGVDDLSSGRSEHLESFRKRLGFRFVLGDTRNVTAMSALLEKWRPITVIHLAAVHFIPAAVADPAFTISLNVHGTQALLTACRAGGVERFWFASTADVYAPAETAHSEDSPVAPMNIYGLSKWMGEQLVALEARYRPQVRFVIGRLFNLYGPRETNPHFIPEIMRHFRACPDEPLRLGNLWPGRDLVPVRDAARAIIDTLHRAPVGITTLNIGTGTAWSMQQVVDLVSELLGRHSEIDTDPAKIRHVERNHLQADVERLRQLIGWTPHANLRRGMAELLSAEGIHVNADLAKP